MEFLGSLKDTISGIFKPENPELDKTKDAIKRELLELKNGGEISHTMSAIREEGRKGFQKDLEEIGIEGEAQGPYLVQFDQKLQEKLGDTEKIRAMENSQEFSEIDNFINDVKNFEGIQQAIEDRKKNPDSTEDKLTKYLSKIPGIGLIVGYFAHSEDDKELSKRGFLTKLAMKIETTLTKKDQKPGEATAAATTTTAAPASTPEAKPAQAETIDWDNYKDKLEKLGIKFDATKLAEEQKTLNLAKNKLDELIVKAEKSESPTQKVVTVIKDKIKPTDNKVELTLADIKYLEETPLQSGVLDKVLAKIKEKGKMEEITPILVKLRENIKDNTKPDAVDTALS